MHLFTIDHTQAQSICCSLSPNSSNLKQQRACLFSAHANMHARVKVTMESSGRHYRNHDKNTKKITVQLNVYFVYIPMQADLCAESCKVFLNLYASF